MLLDLIGTRRVIFFGGKGGVGKTTVAAATATKLIDARGTRRRVLLVSTDPAHNLGHLFDRRIGDTVTEVSPGLDVLELDPKKATQAHLSQVARTMRSLMPEHLHRKVDRHLELSAQAPGTHEAAVLERIAEITEDASSYDHVIFDTAPSCHTSRLMELPELMAAWTDGLLDRRAKSEHLSSVVRGLEPTGKDRVVRDMGPTERRDQQIRSILLKRRTRFTGLRELLTDPQRCVFFIVLTPERLPVLETSEFYAELRSSGVTVGGLVVNRRSPADQGEFLLQRHRLETAALEELARRLPDVPVTELPLASGEISGGARLEEFAARV